MVMVVAVQGDRTREVNRMGVGMVMKGKVGGVGFGFGFICYLS